MKGMSFLKKLPELYKNDITKKITNNKNYCYLNNVEEVKYSPKEQLEKIFSGVGYSYNVPVIIKTKDEELKTSIATRTKNYIVTLENKIIKINDIEKIEIL